MVSPESEQHNFHPNEERTHTLEVAFLTKKMTIFWALAQDGYKEYGRGIILFDNRPRRYSEGISLGYLPKGGIEESLERGQGFYSTQRLVNEYDPSQEMVVVLWQEKPLFPDHAVLGLTRPVYSPYLVPSPIDEETSGT